MLEERRSFKKLSPRKKQHTVEAAAVGKITEFVPQGRRPRLEGASWEVYSVTRVACE